MTQIFLKYEFLFVLIGDRESGYSGKAELFNSVKRSSPALCVRSGGSRWSEESSSSSTQFANLIHVVLVSDVF